MSGNSFITGLATSFNEDSVAADLLKLFQAEHLSLGKNLILHFSQTFGPAAEPRTHAQITVDHIKTYLMNNREYLSTAADGTRSISPAKMERSLQIFRLLELTRNIDDVHKRIIFGAIRNKRSDKGANDNSTVLRAPLDLFKYLEQTTGPFALSDDEVAALYSDIMRHLNSVKHQNNTTQKGMNAVLGEVKAPAQFKDDVQDFFKVVTDHFTAGYTRNAAELYQAEIQKNPALKLEELDFVRNPTRHQQLLVEMLENLRQAEAKPDAKTRGNYEKFNTAFRKLLQERCTTDAEKNKLEAKLHFAMGKLAIVLRQNGCIEDADKISLNIGSTQSNKLKLFGKQSLVLPTGESNARLTQKIIEVFGKLKNFTAELLRRPGLPVEVRGHINLNDVQPQLDEFVQQVDASNDSEARRKYNDRCIKVLNDIDSMYNDRDTRNALRAVGVTSAEVATIEAIVPPAQIFSKFKEDYAKLSERTNIAADGAKPYLSAVQPVAAADPALLKAALKPMYQEMRSRKIYLSPQQQILIDEKNRLERAGNQPVQLAQIAGQIELLNDELATLNAVVPQMKTLLEQNEVVTRDFEEKQAVYRDWQAAKVLLDEFMTGHKAPHPAAQGQQPNQGMENMLRQMFGNPM